MPKKGKMPSRRQLEVMKKKLAKAPGTALLPPDASTVERVKHEICRQIVIHMHAKTMTQRELAHKLGIAETRISEIVHYRIEKFTLDRLLGYLETLHPDVKVHVA